VYPVYENERRDKTLKVSEIVKLLKKNGCYKTKEGANHERWYSPITGKTFSIPRHYGKELMKKTEQSILTDAGLK